MQEHREEEVLQSVELCEGFSLACLCGTIVSLRLRIHAPNTLLSASCYMSDNSIYYHLTHFPDEYTYKKCSEKQISYNSVDTRSRHFQSANKQIHNIRWSEIHQLWSYYWRLFFLFLKASTSMSHLSFPFTNIPGKLTVKNKTAAHNKINFELWIKAGLRNPGEVLQWIWYRTVILKHTQAKWSANHPAKVFVYQCSLQLHQEADWELKVSSTDLQHTVRVAQPRRAANHTAASPAAPSTQTRDQPSDGNSSWWLPAPPVSDLVT